MKNLELSEDNARALYRAGNEKTKQALEVLFGEKLFTTKITDRVKTIQDVVSLTSPTHYELCFIAENGVGKSSNRLCGAMNYFIAELIAEALNEGWEPDWSNRNQVKYVPYFEYNKTGFAFVFSDCAYWTTDTTVGSRLCFKSSDLAIYAGKQFTDIYNDFFLIKH